VIGAVDGRRVAVGNVALMNELRIDLGPARLSADGLRAEGQTAVFVAAGSKVLGVLGVADPIRETTPAAVEALRAQGLRIVMLTGDSRATALSVAARLGITEVIADVLPQEKAAEVQPVAAAWPWPAMA
jgi:Cu+-exporting ATPase